MPAHPLQIEDALASAQALVADYEVLSRKIPEASSVHLAVAVYRPYNVHMDGLRFEWDDDKEKINIRKHGISFDEARTVFFDDRAIQFFDPDHSEEEDRFILLGMSFKLRILIVCHCSREEETLVRIFSARKADKDEEREYWRRRR